jgi:diacylglycerol kinase family enzyme
VHVTADKPVPFHVDGDDGGDTPVEFVAETQRYHILTRG